MEKNHNLFSGVTNILPPQFFLTITFIAIALMGSSVRSFGQGDFGLDMDVEATNVAFDCSCINVTITLTNVEDEPNEDITLDLQLLIDKYEFCDNPGFELEDDPGFNSEIGDVDVWRISDITLQPLDTLIIRARIRVVAFISDLDPSIAATATNGVVTEGPTDAVLVNFNHTVIEVGDDDNDVTYLEDVATGLSGDLLEPPGGNQDVVLRGELVIDTEDPYTFSGDSKIYMGPGAKITIPNGHALNLIEYITIKSCDDAWESIDVQDGGTLNADRFGGNTACTPCELRIEDAEIAIIARNGSNVNANGVKFRNNGIGLSVPFTGSINNPSLSVTDNLFESNEFSQVNGVAGIAVNDLYKSLVSSGNTFNNLNVGISGGNSTLVVNKNKFNNLEFGIWTRSQGTHFLTQTGYGLNEANPTFNDCIVGILSDNVHVNSINNVMLSVDYGYLLQNGAYRNATIDNNIIRAAKTGIGFNKWWATNKQPSLLVSNNEIHMDGDNAKGTGIRAEMVYGLNKSSCAFENNDIELEASRFGIYANGGFKLGIFENEIQMLNNQIYHGIWLDATINNNLFCNLVQGTETDDSQTGILVRSATTNTLSCNTVDLLSVGIQHLGTNQPTFMKGNSFNDHLIGMQYGFNGAQIPTITGVQTHFGNRWEQAYTGGDYGLSHWGDNNEITFSKITYDNNDGSEYSTNQPFGQTSIFSNESGVTFDDCGSGCPPISDFEDEASSVDIAIANGGYTASGDFGTAQTWTAKRQLFRRILATPTLLNSMSPTIIDTFYNDSQRNSVGKFELVAFGMDSLFIPLTGMLVNVEDTIPDTILTRMLVIHEIEEKLDTATYQGVIDSLNTLKQTLIAEVADLQDSLSTIEQTAKTIRMSIAEDIDLENEAITVSEDYEIFQQAVNRIILRNIMDDVTELTEGQLDTLADIANTCPYMGGEAVFQARALLNDGAVYNDSLLCLPPSPIKKPLDNNAMAAFMLYPNPTNGYVQVELKEGAEMEGEVTLFSLFGRQLFSQPIAIGEKQLLLVFDELPAGTYYLKVKTGKTFTTQIFTNFR